MNIPEIYLVEPYNAYAPKQKKKHWHQVIEEQALMARLLAEAESRTLPPNSPNTSVQTVGNMGAGAGGNPFPQYFNPTMNLSFTPSPVTASAPSLVGFANTGDLDLISLRAVSITWKYGDGNTGAGANPTTLYSTTGSFRVEMTASSLKNASNVTMVSKSVLIESPTVTAGFSISGTSVTFVTNSYTASTGNSLTFTNTTTTNNPSNTITYNWTFGSGSITSSLSSPTFTYTATGSYNVRVGATGSYGVTSVATRSLRIN